MMGLRNGGPTTAVGLAVIIAMTMPGGCSSSGGSGAVVAPNGRSASVPAVPAVAGFNLTPVSFDSMPDWSADRHAEALPALQRSCVKVGTNSKSVGGDYRFGSAAQWTQICATARQLGNDDRAVKRFFQDSFTPYLVTYDGSDVGLFTGYYEPVMRGSWRRTATYATPLYRAPAEARAGRQLPSRAQIEAGALRGRDLELIWIDDPVDAFFLQVQGSGRVHMTDGSVVRVGYAGQNGHPYFPIGRELIRRGEIAPENMSMQAIRGWLQAHPGDAAGLMNMNASFIFFRTIDGDGPIGAQGVALTPGRSLAVDPSFIPYGVPLWLDTTDPLEPIRPLRRLVVAQDTGGAIKGGVRGDVFWGEGEGAAQRAGPMKQQGRIFMLLPRAGPSS